MSSEKSKIFKFASHDPQHVGVQRVRRAAGTPEIRLEIDGLAAGGRGVARDGETVWFVPGAVPGDVVLAAPRARRKRFVEGTLLRILQPSPQRREPACEYQPRCGGCPWMVLPEEGQREWKRRIVLDALERIGRLRDVPLAPMVAPGGPTGYRNKVEFSVGLDGAGRPALGLHAASEGGHLVDVGRCLVQHEAANAVLAAARRALLDPPPAPAGFGGERDGPRLVLRYSWSTGRILVVLRETTRAFPRAAALVREIAANHPQVCGIVRLRSRPRRRGGARAVGLFGQPWLEETLAGRTFRLPAGTFLQVNSLGAVELVRLVVEAAGVVEGARVLDLYGGVGGHGLALLGRGAARVDVCDADGAAVACGRAAAEQAGDERIRFHRADAGSFLGGPRGRRAGFDVVVANPPRTGLGPGVGAAILARRPARIVMVSCDPASLARDLAALVRGGCVVERVVPVDLFPQTAHVEAVASLSGPGRG